MGEFGDECAIRCHEVEPGGVVDDVLVRFTVWVDDSLIFRSIEFCHFVDHRLSAGKSSDRLVKVTDISF